MRQDWQTYCQTEIFLCVDIEINKMFWGISIYLIWSYNVQPMIPSHFRTLAGEMRPDLTSLRSKFCTAFWNTFNALPVAEIINKAYFHFVIWKDELKLNLSCLTIFIGMSIALNYIKLYTIMNVVCSVRLKYEICRVNLLNKISVISYVKENSIWVQDHINCTIIQLHKVTVLYKMVIIHFIHIFIMLFMPIP